SRRIGIWIDEALEIVPGEYWRWVIVRLRPEIRDQNFTWSEFYRIINTELNDDIGNYVNRTLTLVLRIGGMLTKPLELSKRDEDTLKEAKSLAFKAIDAYDNIRLKQASEYILEIARLGNKYLNEREPWNLIKANLEEASKALWTATLIVKILAHLIAPIMPKTAQKLWSMLGLEGDVNKIVWDEELYKETNQFNIRRVEPLFTKLPPDFLDKVESIIEEARRKAALKRPHIIRE
ncbi:MAG: class I tRNA ligase family protein, partial [Acidilobaceae archaeon]